MATADETRDHWYGSAGQVSQLRGLLFKASCLGATLLALALVFVFLLYVFNDAIQPATADTGWLLTFVATVVFPALALSGYYYRYDTRAGEVAYTSFGLPIASTLVAGGTVIVFEHIVTPHEWFALVVSSAVALALLTLHSRYRTPSPLERAAVVLLVPFFTVVGIPAIDVGPLATPSLVPSLRGVILSLPFLPLEWVAVLLTFAGPIAAGVAWRVRRVREDDRAAAAAGGFSLAASGLGVVLASIVGIAAVNGILVTTVVLVPIGLYVEHVLRNGEGVSGLVFPVAIGAGAALGAAVVTAMGFSGPELWLDWSFLTENHSRSPEDAGIYPALVGTVMLLIVVAVSAFPVGVGAAIYLEEYAPSQGPMGRVVELIEINIANLAGVPSVVYGVLGLTVFVRGIGFQTGIVIVGGLTVALLILPIVIVSAQEAIRGVPDSVRQASYGMGATRWQTVRNVVVPEAMPGILTGTILALGRAIGETAPLLMVAMAAVVRISPDSFFARSSAMPRQILTWSKLIQTDFRYGVLAAGAVTLLVVLLMMNATAIVLRNRYQRRE